MGSLNIIVISALYSQNVYNMYNDEDVKKSVKKIFHPGFYDIVDCLILIVVKKIN